jgi:hypothetical protein
MGGGDGAPGLKTSLTRLGTMRESSYWTTPRWFSSPKSEYPPVAFYKIRLSYAGIWVMA